MKDKVLEFLIESNAIEGVYDADSLLQAFKAWEFISKKRELKRADILKTHKILMKNQNLLPEEKGVFRERAVFTGGVEAISWYIIEEAIEPWRMNIWLYPKGWKAHHIRYEKIHPFIDGNGRTGRIFMNWERLKVGLPILIIKESEKEKYYRWFK